jgi:hypothetical protein
VAVDAASPDPSRRRLYLWDTEIKGFGLLVLPSGIKNYIFRYRTPEGCERRAIIGKHGDWAPDHARDKADDMRQAVKAGGDPLGERIERRSALKPACPRASACMDCGTRLRLTWPWGLRRRPRS